MELNVIAIDIAKKVFQLHWVEPDTGTSSANAIRASRLARLHHRPDIRLQPCLLIIMRIHHLQSGRRPYKRFPNEAVEKPCEGRGADSGITGKTRICIATSFSSNPSSSDPPSSWNADPAGCRLLPGKPPPALAAQI